MAEDWGKISEGIPPEYLRDFARIALEMHPDLSAEWNRIARKVQQERQAEEEEIKQEQKTWEDEWNAILQTVNPQNVWELGALCDQLVEWADKKNTKFTTERRWRAGCQFNRWACEHAMVLDKNPKAFGLSFNEDDWFAWTEEKIDSHDAGDLVHITGGNWLKGIHLSLETVGMQIFRDFLYTGTMNDPFPYRMSFALKDNEWVMDLLRKEEQRILREEPDTERGRTALAYIHEVCDLAKAWHGDPALDDGDNMGDEVENEDGTGKGEDDMFFEEKDASDEEPEENPVPVEVPEAPVSEETEWEQVLDAILEANGRGADADIIGIAEGMEHLIAERTDAYLQEKQCLKAHAFCKTAYAWMEEQVPQLEPKSMGSKTAPYLVQAVMNSCCRAWVSIVPAAPAKEQIQMLNELSEIQWPWEHDPLAILLRELKQLGVDGATLQENGAPEKPEADPSPDVEPEPESAPAQAVEPEREPDPESEIEVPEFSQNEDEESWQELFEQIAEDLDLEEAQDLERYCRWLIRLGESRVQGFRKAELQLKAHWFTVVLYGEVRELQDIVEEMDFEDDELSVGPEDVMKACAGWWKQILAETDDEGKAELFEDILDVCRGEWGNYAEEVLLQTEWGQEEQVELLDYLGRAMEDADYEDRRQQLLQKLMDAEKTVARYSGPIAGGNASGELIQNWRRKLSRAVDDADMDDYDGLGNLASELLHMMEDKVRELVQIQDYLGAYQHVMEVYLLEKRLDEDFISGKRITYYRPEQGEESYFLDTWDECGEMIGAIACLASPEIRRGIFKDLFAIAKQTTDGLMCPLTEGPWSREEMEEVLEYLERRRTYEPSDDLEEYIETVQDHIKDPVGFEESWDVKSILGLDDDEDDEEDEDEDWDSEEDEDDDDLDDDWDDWDDDEDDDEDEDDDDWDDWDDEEEDEDDDEDSEDDEETGESAASGGKDGSVDQSTSDAKSYDYLFWDNHFEDLWVRRIQTEVDYADFDDADGLDDFCKGLADLLERQVGELKRKGCWRGAFCSCVRLYRESYRLQQELEDGELSPFAEDYLEDDEDAMTPIDVAEECTWTVGQIMKEAPAESKNRILKELSGIANTMQEDFRKVLREAPWTAEQRQELLVALGEQTKVEVAPKPAPKPEVAGKVGVPSKPAGKPAPQPAKKKSGSTKPKQSVEEASARKRLADYRRSGLTQQYWEELRKLVLESSWATVEDVRMLKSMSPVRKWQGVLEELKSSSAWKDRLGELQEFLGK